MVISFYNKNKVNCVNFIFIINRKFEGGINMNIMLLGAPGAGKEHNQNI